MIVFLNGKIIEYFAIINAFLNKAVFFLNVSKKQRLVPHTT
jgi:hypothetical protein